jgi:hypothetical protein
MAKTTVQIGIHSCHISCAHVFIDHEFAIDGWLCARRFGDRTAGLATRTDKSPSHSVLFCVGTVLLLAMCCVCGRQLKVCPQESLWAPAGIERPATP